MGTETDIDYAWQATVRTLFDEVANEYGDVSFFKLLGASFVRWLSVAPGSTVLDLAAGRGAVAVPLSLSPSAPTVFVADLSVNMVKQLGELLNTHRAIATSALQLGFRDDLFDYVTCAFGLNFFIPVERALAEMRRVLKPKGCLAISTPAVPSPGGFVEFNELVSRFMKTVDKSVWRPRSINDPAALLQRNGFEVIEQSREEVVVAFDDWDSFWRTQMSHGLRGFWKALTSTQKAEFYEQARSLFEAVPSSERRVAHAAWFCRATT